MKTYILRNILLLLAGFLPLSAMSQSDRDLIRQGNKDYRAKRYPQAEVKYRKALSVNSSNPQALYNLACALMVQNKAKEAVELYQKAAAVEKNKIRKAMSYHNIGVICQSAEMYDEAIKAYSEALRNNPRDNATRYNLALCKKLQKKNNQKNSGGKNKDNKNNKDKNKDKNKKEQDKNQQNDKEKQNDKNSKSQEKEPQQPQMSKENAEQLLNAAMQQEQQTQQRLNKSMQQRQTRRLQKNW